MTGHETTTLANPRHSDDNDRGGGHRHLRCNATWLAAGRLVVRCHGLRGAYAAAIGTILGACVLLGRIAIGDWFTAAIGLIALVVLFLWKVNNPLLMAVTAGAGIIAFPILHPAWVMVK